MLKRTLAMLLAALLAAGCTQDQAPDPSAKGKVEGQTKARTVDDALASGADWLLKQQKEDGSFGEMAQIGLTSFVVTAALGSPEGEKCREDERVQKAVAYLVKQVQPDGSINTPDSRGLANYQTAAALSALTAYDDDAHKDIRKGAADFLLSIQNTEGTDFGSWGYNSSKRGDLSNSQFSLEALKAAGLAEDSEAFKRCVTFLQRCQNRSESNDQPYSGNDGGAMYYPGNSKAGVIELPDGRQIPRSYGSMTYALLRCYVLCGIRPDDARVQAALKWLGENYTLDVNPGMPEGQEHQGLYYYYLTMAKALPLAGVKMLKLDDGTEVNWAKELSERLISLQREDGSWVNDKAERWYEGDPLLATGYAMFALAECKATLER